MAALLGIAAFASSRLTVERGPSFLGPDVINGGLALYPEPKLALAGRFGQRGSARGDSISARVVGSTRTLVGDTVVPLRDGKAVFDRMGVRGLTKDSMTIEFHSRRTGATTRFWLPSGASSRDRLTMNAASINGTRLSRALDTVVVHPGDSLSGSIETQYTSSDPAATVVLGMTPTWGRHEKEAQLVGYLLPTAQDRNRQESIRLKAPEIPGTYHLVFVFGAEANERFLLSGTNWTIGRPEWEDSNDVASIPAPELLAASERGYDSLVVPELHEGHRRSRLSFFGLTALTVIVK